MLIAKTILFFALISISVACGFIIGQQTNVAVIAQKQTIIPSKTFEVLRRIKQEKIRDFVFIGDGENEFYGVIRRVNEPPIDDPMFKTSDKLTIYDKSGKPVYETKDVSIGGFTTNRFLNSESKEIMFSSNGGGTDDFLTILSYKNGKFVEISNLNDFQYRGGYFTMLQYRTNMKIPYSKPSQLIVIQQQGGSDENPTASVFRTKDNKFQKVGEIRMQELGDFIENQIAQKK
jgi:hypothetical protein